MLTGYLWFWCLALAWGIRRAEAYRRITRPGQMQVHNTQLLVLRTNASQVSGTNPLRIHDGTAAKLQRARTAPVCASTRYGLLWS